jgi:hypothetical protein
LTQALTWHERRGRVVRETGGEKTVVTSDPSRTLETPGLVWYVAYGSNLCASRFSYYLRGGTPPGAHRCYIGARDGSAPRAVESLWLPGGIFFTGVSVTWTGGVALYDPSLSGRTAAQAYLVSLEQFGDVLTQETYRPEGSQWEVDVGELTARGRLTVGPGRYETLHHLGERHGYPMVTFTAPFTAAQAELAAPAAGYLTVIGSGLVQAHGLTPVQAGAYLAAAPGAAGVWGADEVARLLDPSGAFGAD